jgi:hypothetical protein
MKPNTQGNIPIQKHKHIWKYINNDSVKNIRICEAPFPTIKSCGMIQGKENGEWITLHPKPL